MKPLITASQESVLAYLSASAPHGNEFTVSISQVATDLGYKDRRNVYYALSRLRDIGAVTMISKRHWRATTLICHAREEQFTVIAKMSGGRAARRRRDAA